MKRTASPLRSKTAYLNESDIELRLQNGDLDAYDVVYTKDTYQCFIISPELVPIKIRTKVYVFKSIQEAETELNKNQDTYEGQVVSILTDNAYTGYIVNKNPDGKFHVTSLAVSGENLDYNALGNKPIDNLTGTLDKKIIVDTLKNGIYAVDGIYKISEKEETIYSTVSKIIFLIEHDNDKNIVHIKKISAFEMTDFTVSDTVAVSNILTTEYLKENGYITSDELDTKLATLNYITKDEAQKYIEESVSRIMGEVIDQKVDEKIDQKLNEKLQSTSNDEIKDLFNPKSLINA